jgi:hypothetical protein
VAAHEWLSLSADAGSPLARVQLAAIEPRMSEREIEKARRAAQARREGFAPPGSQ